MVENMGGNLGRIGSRAGKHVRVLHTAGASGTGGSARRQYPSWICRRSWSARRIRASGHAPHAGGTRHPVPEPHRQQGGPAFRPRLAGEGAAQAGSHHHRSPARRWGLPPGPAPCGGAAAALAAPVPLVLVGGPREGLAISEFKDKPYPVEVIPAITVRCVRSTPPQAV